MAYVRVVFSSVPKLDRLIKSAIRELSQIEAELCMVQSLLPSEVGARYQISQRLENCRMSTNQARAKASKLMNTVSDGIENYRRAESRLQKEISEVLAASSRL